MSGAANGARPNGRPSHAELLDAATGYEDLIVTHGRRSGALIAVAVHSTALGPALGGARLWHFDSPSDAVVDAMRLARAMTYKAAAAGLRLGGGKGVICAPAPQAPAGEERRAVMLDFADAVESLDGRYVTAEDVGTSTADMAVIAERTGHVVGLPSERGGSGDPSPETARGVVAAIQACLSHRTGSDRLAGRRVCLIGAGHVGSRLARLLTASGAELTISDIDPSRRGLAEELGARWVDPGDEVAVECDVLCPCALGGAIDDGNVGRLRCAIVCGSANNVLAGEHLAEELNARGILYAPDFIANVGGLISVYGELHDLSAPQVRRLVIGIGENLGRILAGAEQASITPLAAARELSEARLAGAAAVAA
jgi:leucine dehydrogenase